MISWIKHLFCRHCFVIDNQVSIGFSTPISCVKCKKFKLTESKKEIEQAVANQQFLNDMNAFIADVKNAIGD